MSSQKAANVRVLVRIRPHSDSELNRLNVLKFDASKSNCKIDFNHGETKDTGVSLTVNSSSNDRRPTTANESSRLLSGYISDENNINSTKQFMFDAIHGPTSSQEDVYSSVEGIVDAVCSGYNGTIVAYGQTGSGKTYTVFGNSDNKTESGLVQNIVRDIFIKSNKLGVDEAETSDKDGKTTMSFSTSFFEIFNERIYDLLSTDSLENNLSIREDATNGVYVEGLTETSVQNASDVEKVLGKGSANRHVASTKMNRSSSRSHAVFVLSLKSEHVSSDGIRKIRSSKFTLVDLAGSERQKSTECYGERLKEASMINKSLLCLGHVINALVDKEAGKSRHVPFRNSKLTFLLRDTWGGNSKTCLLATISPSIASLGETISTLHFAQRAKLIKNNAVLNENTVGTITALQAEVAKLRYQLRESSSDIDCKRLSSYVDDSYAAMKRRAERAEEKIALLEMRLSEGEEKEKSLKRKVQEEVMVRKFKERRLDYFQKKSGGSSHDEQVKLLKEEIAVLQKQLETPSADAIEWRVAYEQLKEELEKRTEGDMDGYLKLEQEKSELEETIDRLLNEREALEERISELASSSTETQEEIESILKEVDRLERANKNIEEYETAQADLQQNLSAANTRIVEKQTRNEELEATISQLTQKIEALTASLEEKSQDLLAFESLTQDIEKELQSSIEKLNKENIDKEEMLNEKNKTLEDLSSQLSCLKEESIYQLDLIEEQKLQIEEQRILISGLEEKIKSISYERNDAIESLKNEKDLLEREMNVTIQNLKDDINSLENNMESAKSELSQYYEKERVMNSDIEKNETFIADLKTKLSNLDKEKSDLEQSMESIKSEYQSTVLHKEELVNELELKIQELSSERETSLARSKAIEEQRVDAVHSELQSKIDALIKEKEEIQLSLKEEIHQIKMKYEDEIEALKTEFININAEKEEADVKLKELESNLQELKSKINQSESLLRETSTDLENMKQSKDLLDAELKEKLRVESELKEDLKKMESEKSHILDDLTQKNDLLQTTQHNFDSVTKELAKAKEELSALESDKESVNVLSDAKLKELESQLSSILGEKMSVEEQHQSLAREVNVLRSEKNCLSNKIQQLEGKLAESLKAQDCKSKETSDEILKMQAKYIDEISGLKNQLEMSNEEHKELQKRLEEVQNLNDTLCNVKTELEHVIEEKNLLQATLDEEKSKLNDVTSKIALMESISKDFEETKRSLESSHSVVEHELKMKIKSLETDCSHFKKWSDSSAAAEANAKRDLMLQKDRVVLLKREKANIQYEIETLRKDRDSLEKDVSEKERTIQNLNDENRGLKRRIEELEKSSAVCSTKKRRHVDVEENVVCYDDGNSVSESFDNLSAKMDSMLERMSTGHTAPLESVDESFDESMFLPNVGEKVIYDEKENDATTFAHATPMKVDYGAKRKPLSDRKDNMTPSAVTSTKKNKHLTRSSAKKRYMVYDNNNIFGDVDM